MAVTVTLAGVVLTGAQQPLPVPIAIGEGPPDEIHITQDSPTQGARRIPVLRPYHESWDDIEFDCTVTNITDFNTLAASYRAKQTVVTYVYSGTTWTCAWYAGGFKPVRFNWDVNYFKVHIKLRVLGSA